MVEVVSEDGILSFPVSIAEQLTPSAYEYVGDFLRHVVEPIFQGVLSSYDLSSDFKFEKIDLGSMVPSFKLISSQVRKRGSESCIVSDFEYSYDGNCDIKVSVLGILSGVKDVILKGTARTVLQPVTKKALPLFVGGAQVTLLDVPHIYFDMEGLAEVCDWPVIRAKLRKELYRAIQKRFVYPNKCSFPLSMGVDAMSYHAFVPSGMLAVKLNFAEGLPVKGSIIRSLVGQDKPDTYAKIILGADEKESQVVKNTTEPSWENEVVWHEFLLENLSGHKLRVEVYDEDTLSKDEFLGEFYVDLGEETSQPGEFPLTKDLLSNEFKKTKYDIQGKFTLTLRWLPIGSGESLNHYEGPSRAVFSVYIYSCNNLVLQEGEESIWGSAFVSLEFDGQTRSTPVKKFNPHPEFSHGETFTCKEGFSNQEARLMIKDESGFDFGTLQLPLIEYHKSPIHRKILVLNSENPFATITLSASVQSI